MIKIINIVTNEICFVYIEIMTFGVVSGLCPEHETFLRLLKEEGNMLLKILGWFWITGGILFLWKPEWLRNRLKKKSVKTVRRFLFSLILCVSVLLIKGAWGVPGILAKIILVLGMIGIMKAFYLLKAKTASVIIDWFVNQPAVFFRIAAAVHLIIGVVLLQVRA